MTSTTDAFTPAVEFTFNPTFAYFFLKGDCWVLAQTVNELHNLPMVTFSGAGNTWFHAANLLPDGRILDAEGIWSQESWFGYWNTIVEGYADEDSLGSLSAEQLYGSLHIKHWTVEDFNAMLVEESMTPMFNVNNHAAPYAALMMQHVEAQLPVAA